MTRMSNVSAPSRFPAEPHESVSVAPADYQGKRKKAEEDLKTAGERNRIPANTRSEQDVGTSSNVLSPAERTRLANRARHHVGRFIGPAPSEIRRSNSLPAPGVRKLAPEVRRFDTLLHQADSLKFNAGTLMISRNKPEEWTRIECSPNSLLQNIEIRPERGLLNLTGSAQFCSGELSQTQKRDLTRAVVSIVTAYNEVAAEEGKAPITIHENHFKGDGNIYEHRKLPRESNERDYDYYHTLGVNFTDNGNMMPHFHLEFGGGRLIKGEVKAVLESLQEVGKKISQEREILTSNDIVAVLANFTESTDQVSSINAARIDNKRLPLPNELDSQRERAERRDELEGQYVALASANIQSKTSNKIISNTGPLQNAYRNTFRLAEPMFECFSAGHTSVHDDLGKIEGNDQLDFSDLTDIHYALNKAHKELMNYTEKDSNPTEYGQLMNRLRDGLTRTTELLKSHSPHLPDSTA